MSTALNKWDLERLAGLFSQASAIALSYFDDPPAELKSDRSVVTAADREIEQLFAECCDLPAEGVYLIGEETVDKRSEEYVQKALQSDICWVLDPIDGTAPYSAHLPMWGMSLGLMKQGKLIEGAIALPCLDIILATSQDQILCRRLSSNDWEIFTPQKNHLGSAGHIAIGQLQAHRWVFDGANQLFAWSSCVGSVYWVLSGRAAAYCGDFKLWDMAGLLPILRSAQYPILSTAAEHMPLSPDMADGMFELSPESPRRWKVKAPVITAADSRTALELLEKFHSAAQI